MQIRRRRAEVAAIALAFGLALPAEGQAPGSGTPQPQNLPSREDLRVGTFVQVEGRFVGDLLHADQIEVFLTPLDEEALEAEVEAVNRFAMKLTLAGREVSVTDGTKIYTDRDRSPLLFSDLETGQRVKVTGRLENGVVIARKLKVRTPTARKDSPVKIEARIEQADLATDTIVVLETKVKLTPRTEFQIGG